jgi:hypothetical protein
MSPTSTGRRGLLMGGAVLAGTAASQGLLGAPAAAAAYTVNPYRTTEAPTATQLHLMNRMGFGYARPTFARMRKAGSAGAWYRGVLGEVIGARFPDRSLSSVLPGLSPAPLGLMA